MNESILDLGTISCIFHSKYMDPLLANKLESVSKPFYTSAWLYKRGLKEIDLDILCNYYAFEEAVLRHYAAQCPKLESIVNIEVTSRKIDCMDLLSTMTNLTKVHFVCFQLNDQTFTCLCTLPSLNDLSIDRMFVDTETYDIGSERRFSGRPRLNLRRLAIGPFGEFSSLCNPQLLTSLSLTFSTLELSDKDVGTYCRNIRNCTKIQTLHLTVDILIPLFGFLPSEIVIRPFLTEVASLPNLVNFCLTTHDHNRPGSVNFARVLGGFCGNLVGLDITASHLLPMDWSVYFPFTNLRHVTCYSRELDQNVVFGGLPSLNSLTCVLSPEPSYKYGSYAVTCKIRAHFQRLFRLLCLYPYLVKFVYLQYRSSRQSRVTCSTALKINFKVTLVSDFEFFNRHIHQIYLQTITYRTRILWLMTCTKMSSENGATRPTI